MTVTPREILLGRPRLRSTQGDLTALLTQVKDQLEQLEVPVKGVISDGEDTIESAVAFVFSEVAHQWCQFHAFLGCHCPPRRRQNAIEEAPARSAPH